MSVHDVIGAYDSINVCGSTHLATVVLEDELIIYGSKTLSG